MSRKYLPPNGTEGMAFEEKFCERCWRDAAYRNGTGDGCKILAAASVARYGEGPKEWVYDSNLHPTCTAFAESRPRKKVIPQPISDAPLWREPKED